MQQNKHNQWHPIAFINRSLTKAEANYSTTEKELLVILWALHKFHPYVHGNDTVIETDHQPLPAFYFKKAILLAGYCDGSYLYKNTSSTSSTKKVFIIA